MGSMTQQTPADFDPADWPTAHGIRPLPMATISDREAWEDTGWLPTLEDLDQASPTVRAAAPAPVEPTRVPTSPPAAWPISQPTPARPSPVPDAPAPADRRRKARVAKPGLFRSLFDTTLSRPVDSTMVKQSYLLLVVLSGLLWLLPPIATVLVNATLDLPTVRALALVWFLVGWVPALAFLMIGRLVLGLLHDHTQRAGR